MDVPTFLSQFPEFAALNDGTTTPSVVASATATLTFSAASHTVTLSSGSFLALAFAVGQNVTASGTSSNNGALGPILALTPTVMTFAAGLVNEGPDTSGATLTGPTLNNQGLSLLSAMLAAAQLEIDATVWNAKSDQGTAYLMAHKLALSPFGNKARLVADKRPGDGPHGQTTYGAHYDSLVRQVASGFRVA